MNYVRWKEGHTGGDTFDHLKRGHIYRNKDGAVFLYVGYCKIDIPETIEVKGYNGEAEVLIDLCCSFDSPILDKVIKNTIMSLKHKCYEDYLLVENSKYGVKTLHLFDKGSKHPLLHELIEFKIPSEVLWNIKELVCDYAEYYNMGRDYNNLCIKYEHHQDTLSFSAVLLTANNTCFRNKDLIFYDVSLENESFEDFHKRTLRKVKLFLKIIQSM